jgi:hypothetical protein
MIAGIVNFIIVSFASWGIMSVSIAKTLTGYAMLADLRTMHIGLCPQIVLVH